MIVVTDAGPLIYLAAVGHLDLLRVLFAQVVVPRLVHEEVVVAGAGLPGAAEVAAAAWLQVVEAPADAALLNEVEPGEAAAIPLALSLGAVLLCDDAGARAVARRSGIPVVGTLGVLVQAKRDHHVALVAPIISRMRNLGMFVSDALVDEVLGLVGER